MSGVRFGVLVQAVDTPRDFVSLVRRVEALGFEHLWVADSSLHGRCAFTYLALAAANSTTLRLGTGITHPVTRHPAVVANSLATLQEISEGRAVLGLGAGDRPVLELGLKPASLKAVEEMVAVCRRLFTEKDVTFEGETVSTVGASLVSRPGVPPPVYVAASGPRTLGLAGRIGDGVIVQAGAHPDTIGYALQHVRGGADDAGREFSAIDATVILYGALDPDGRRARDAARPFAAWIPQTVPEYCRIAGIPERDVEAVRRRYSGGELMKAHDAAGAVSDAMVDAFTLSGTPNECRDRVEQVVEATGIGHVTFFPMGEDRIASIERFADAVAAPLR